MKRALLIGLFPLLASAADWPQWGGADPGRNMVSTETGLADSFKARNPTENVRWTVKLGTSVQGNPTVSNGRVFVGTDDALLDDDKRFVRSHGGMIQCLDEATGKLLWKLPVPVRPRDRLPAGAHYGEQKLGVCSSPAVQGNRVFVVTGSCEVMCLDVQGMANGNDGPFQSEAKYFAGPNRQPVKLGKSDGDIIWSYDLVDQLGICPHDVAACSPIVDGRFLYTVSCNGVDRPHEKCLRPDAPSFICLDTETGKLLATDTEGLGHRMWHCLWSPPSIGVVNGKKLVFFGGADGVCYAFEALTEVPKEPIHFKKVWSYDCDPPEFRMPGGKSINYYVGDKRKRYSTNRDDGTFLGPSEIIASPVFHEGRVYCTIGQDPTHGRGRGLLHCIDASKTGDITKSGNVWTYEGIERTIASVAIKDGLLFAVDNDTVRNDLLDYAYEVEYFDSHLGRMLDLLEKRGQLDSTIVIVTSDNGMPFPRIKGQEYAASNHLPLAIMWKNGLKSPGRTVDDYVSFIDFAPTFLELAQLPQDQSGMAPITGRSLVEILRSDKAGRVTAERDHVLIGKERHDVGRPDDVGYPIRGVIKDEMLYLQNFETDRWPAGNPETGYPNTDGGPTKTEVLNARRDGSNAKFWELCFGKRGAEEMYNLKTDPNCLTNIAGKAEVEPTRSALQQQMLYELKQQQDPRMFGRGAEFDQYPYADEKFKNLYNRLKAGEKIVPNWLTPTDMEKDPTK